MQLTIDSSESLTDVLRAVGALFSVELSVGTANSGSPAAETTPAAPARSTRRAAGSRARGTTTRSRSGGGRTSRRAGAAKPGSSAARRLAADIRAWAAQNGHEVSARGRIPSNVVQAYEAAQH